MDGVVDQIDVEEGEYMREGEALGRLLSLREVKALVAIPEKYVDHVARQKTAEVYVEALNETLKARIDRVAFGGNLKTNTFEATLILDNPDLRLRPGMIAQSTLVIQEKTDAVLVPLFSLVKDEEGMKVFVEENGVVHERLVELEPSRRTGRKLSTG